MLRIKSKGTLLIILLYSCQGQVADQFWKTCAGLDGDKRFVQGTMQKWVSIPNNAVATSVLENANECGLETSDFLKAINGRQVRNYLSPKI